MEGPQQIITTIREKKASLEVQRFLCCQKAQLQHQSTASAIVKSLVTSNNKVPAA